MKMLKMERFYDNSLETLTLNILKFQEDTVKSNFQQNNGQLEDIKNFQYLHIDKDSSQDIMQIIREGSCLRELSLSYSLLSEDLLRAISASNDISLETLRIQVHSDDSKALVPINKEAWFTSDSHLPKFNIALSCYIENDEDYEILLKDASIPVTHLFLAGPVSANIIMRINENCLHLVELIVTSYTSGLMDDQLIAIGKTCTKLVALGLGECELTCSTLVRFVQMCKERLQILYVWETSLIEDVYFDVTSAVAKVSSILGRDWAPEYVPPW